MKFVKNTDLPSKKKGFIEQYLSEIEHVNKTAIIILAAGKATRFFDFGKNYAKCILPYLGKPIIVHNINNAKNLYPNSDIFITVPEGNQDVIESITSIIRLHFTKEESEKITFIQQKPLGPGYSIQNALMHIDNYQSALVLLGDVVVEMQQLQRDKILESNYVLSYNNVDDWSRWCIVDTETGKLYDKPEVRPDVKILSALSGFYYFGNFKRLKETVEDLGPIKGKEFQISEILKAYNMHFKPTFIPMHVLDFGTISDWKENSGVPKSRSFNVIEDHGDCILKKSKHAEKLYQEYSWLKTMNNSVGISNYIPKVFDFNINDCSFVMEKIEAPTLRDIFLFLDRSEETWLIIFDKLFAFLNGMIINDNPSSTEFWYSIHKKTIERTMNGFMDNDVKVFLTELEDVIFNNRPTPCIMHGDFHFGNIFYDGGKIKLIDPKGIIYGCTEYELAKLMHSVCYYYDFIDSNLFLDNAHTNYFASKCIKISKIFIDKCKENGYNVNLIRMITASLFLSMIPLHSHSSKNQKIYFNIFKEAYREWKKNDN